MKTLKTISVPSLRLFAGQREFSLHGGFLYIDGVPVQSYFSRNMFYWEEEKTHGAIYLNHHGLMADVHLIQNGKKTVYKAASEMHYEMDYDQKGTKKHLDVCFGITFDSNGSTHYYCGLKYNGAVIIPIPKTDEEKWAQKIMTVTVTSKELLNIVLDTSNYHSALQDFPIVQIDMTFDAAYNTCDVVITEGQLDIQQYMADSFQNLLTGETAAKGNCTVNYQSIDKNQHKVELEVDSVKVENNIKYYGSLIYDGKTVIPMPTTAEEKANQNYISCLKLSEKWILRLNNLKLADDLMLFMTLSTTSASVTLNGSKTEKYHTTGKIVLTDVLKKRNRRFQANANEMARLKTNCDILGFRDSNLSVDELFSLDPPPSGEITDKNDPSKVVKMDGQAYSHQKSTEVLTYLAAYYTADIKSSDGNLSYEDLYGYKKEAALTFVNQINSKIITEIENEKDEKGNQYVVDFLKKFSDIILASSYAGSSNTYIQKGFTGIKNPVKKCQYYLSDDHENALQREIGYQVATKIIDKYVYASLVPKLSKYIENNSENWAEQLYYMAVDRLAMIKLQCIGDKNKGTHISKMLAILDSKKHVIKDGINGEPLKDSDGKEIEMPYAAALYAQIFNFSLAEIGNTFKGVDEIEGFLRILEIFFGDLYDKVKGGQASDIPQEVLDELNKHLELNREMFIEIQIFQIQSFIQYMAASGDLSSAFVKYGLNTKTFSKFLSCFTYVLMGISYASILGSWNSLTDAEKAQSIMGCLLVIVGPVREASIWYSVKKLLDPNVSPEARVQAAYRLKFGGEDFERIESMMPRTEGENINLSERLENTSRRYSLEIKDVNGAKVKLSGFSKFFVGTEIFFQLLNIALMAYAFVMAVINLVNLFKYHYSAALKAVAVCNTIVIGVAAIAGFASFAISFTALAITSSIASVLPIVGQVCMLISFVFSIVELFLYPKEPTPSIQLIIEEHLALTVRTLDDPTAEWEQKVSGEKVQLAMA